MKIYNLKKDDRFTILGDALQKIYRFEKLDGAYTICYRGDYVIHLSCYTDIKKVNDDDAN